LHETLTHGGRSLDVDDGPRVKHLRGDADGPCIVNRNYKVMSHLYAQDGGKVDPRFLFYFGEACLSAGKPEEALQRWNEYVKVGTWDEELCKARLYMGGIHERAGDYRAALAEYAIAAADRPETPESWFGLARVAYFRERWDRCVEWTERGLAACKVKPGSLWYSSDARTFDPHLYYNVALFRLGRLDEAIASCEAGLSVRQNSMLGQNHGFYLCQRALSPAAVQSA
jgi:tetratricopeptide (TPR) repeat protein